MASPIPPPDVRTLLPPLLACLPTAFASPRPPPALLPLLSPILRQRVQLLSATAETPADSWLPLLCWEPGAAEKLSSIVEGEAFELHPVSGEIEYGEMGPIEYRRLDEETLHAKADIVDLGLVVVYAWCQGDRQGDDDGWRVAEVSPLGTRSEHATLDWWPSIAVAETKAKEIETKAKEVGTNGYSAGMVRQAVGEDGADMNGDGGVGEDDKDDDYWAQYDRTPGRTPAPNRSPMPGLSSSTEHRGRSASTAAYFERYSQVQPEMDNDDPSQNRAAIGESSLNDNVVAGSISQGVGVIPSTIPRNAAEGNATDMAHSNVSQPRASSPKAAPEAVPRYEDSAASPSASETAIKQHVSTSIKSLFRLCRNAGIERPEFEELVHTELETLSMLTEDD